jgi:hypothetical protein
MQGKGESTSGYTPVRRSLFGNAFHALQKSPQYRDFLIQVRDRFISQPNQGYWLRELFWAVGTTDTTTLGVLDELLHSNDKMKTSAAVDLIGGAPAEFALACPFFAIHVIEESKQFGDLGERAGSLLIANAHSGSFQRTAGQRSPRYLSMMERAVYLRDVIAADSTGRTFFSTLFESALAALEREGVDDEEIRFG